MVDQEARAARVVENRPLTRDVHHLVITPTEGPGLDFRAGQYCLFPSPGGGPPRPLSIASPPQRSGRLEFCFRRIEGGQVTSALTGVRAGDTIRFLGPLGRFTLREEDERRLFVATGTGIAPIRSMLLDQLARGDRRPALLVFGNRSPSGIYYRDEFEALAADRPEFRFVASISSGKTDAPDQQRGRVTDVLTRILDDPMRWSAYLCGNPGMIQDATRILVRLGVPEERCHREI